MTMFHRLKPLSLENEEKPKPSSNADKKEIEDTKETEKEKTEQKQESNEMKLDESETLGKGTAESAADWIERIKKKEEEMYEFQMI